MSIIISKDGLNAQKLTRTVIEQEDYLQQYIYNNPDCLPLDELKENLRLLILTREFDTPSGPIDALGVDADGEIYIIETKLYKNPDKRKVIAQMLDYGAAVWSSPTSIIDRANETEWRNRLLEFLENDEDAVTAHIEALTQNANAGHFWFVVLMDRLDDRLKTLISFVNQHSEFKVLGVELDFYRHTEFEIIIPKLFGGESATEPVTARSGHSRPNRKLDEEQFFSNAEKNDEARESIDKLREILSWSKINGRGPEPDWGRDSFIPRFEHADVSKIFAVYTNGDLELKFGELENIPNSRAAEFACKLRHALQQEVIVDLTKYARKFPRLPIAVWCPVLPKFLAIIERLLLESK